jgi:citrate synthase
MNFTVQAIQAFLPKLQPILATHSEVIALPYDGEAGETPERAALRQKRHEQMLQLGHDERRMVAAFAKTLHRVAAAMIVFDDALPPNSTEPRHDR